MAERLKAVASIIDQQSRLKTIRANNTLDGTEFKNLVFGQANYERYIAPMLDYFQANKNIFTHHNREGQNREQMREHAARMVLAIMKFNKIDLQRQPLKLIFAIWAAAYLDTGVGVKAFLHYFLYTKTILLFQNHPKHKEYLENAVNLKDLGCFGLTEFHHGSYSKDIQTLSTYHHKNKEFVLTTQGQKGMKYWIGAASQFANMAIIWAQLIFEGKSQGPHPFVVPIRCKKTHRVLPGITIGDCGLKNGLNYVDNGYIILDDVRIPSYNLLGKIGSIDQNGNYVTLIENSNARFGLFMSPLSGGRGVVSFSANVAAIKAVTIALRYACNRKQFDNSKKTDEVLIIDYALTKNRLIPALAQTIVQINPGLQMGEAYFSDPTIFSDLKYMGELHAVSAAVKARISWNTTAVAQDTRSVLGGHGYSAFNNYSSFFHDTDVNNTWEGDNNMMLQQTSKYLMKNIPKQTKTKIVDLSFVWNAATIDQEKLQGKLRSLDTLGLLLRDLFVTKYRNAKQVYQELSKQYKEKSEVWPHFHPQAGNFLAITFADYYIFITTSKIVLSAKNDKNKDFLFKCLLLWGYHLLESERYGSLQLRKDFKREVVALCDELTEPAIIATDILMPSSHVTGSALGNFDDGGLQDYINSVYTAKDTFTRASYFSEILKARNTV